MGLKLKGYEFWCNALKSPRHVLAPMVEHSELAWRIFARRYGAQLCYTPMLNAKCFVEEKSYRSRPENLSTNEADRPLIVQFCANDPEILLKAARMVEHMCDGVDINLGCPQNIARRGHYGSFLQDEWDLIERMVRILDENLAVPVTCKIRIFPQVEKSIKYAQMLEKAGCQILTVHGRTRDQKGANTGLADWDQIRRIKQSVNIPVFANGNILYYEDIQKCIDYTGVDGVMSAEGHLYNPAIFTPQIRFIWEMVDEFLEICQNTLNADSCVRGHLFKMYRPCIMKYTDLRDRLGKLHTLDEFREIAKEFNERLQLDAAQSSIDLSNVPVINGIKQYPHWISQPCIRLPEQEISSASLEEIAEKRKLVAATRAENKMKEKPRTRELPICMHCKSHVGSLKCFQNRCKKCCLMTIGTNTCEQHRPPRDMKKIKVCCN